MAVDRAARAAIYFTFTTACILAQDGGRPALAEALADLVDVPDSERVTEAVAARTPVLDPRLFPVPTKLEPNVAFWRKVFSEYTSDQVVLHDEDHLDVLYVVLDFSLLEASDLSDIEKERRRREVVRKTTQHYTSLLLALASGTALDDEDHRRVETLLRTVPGGSAKYRAAAERIRTQTGLKDRFASAVERSGRYLPAMEETFERHGVPVELTRIAFVESMFQEGARSKVGAGGIWQLMPATARGYLTISAEVDERFDPLLAADAAARILRSNHEVLDSWPLAVTAYNHGVNGMKRAVATLGTRDPGEVLFRHSSRTYGFASRNFYAEFVAAAYIYAERQLHFPDARPQTPMAWDAFVPDAYVSVVDLAREAALDLPELQALNPAFDSEIWQGGLLVPRGYRLRVPQGAAERTATAYAGLPASSKSPHQAGHRHRVRRGDTLSAIAHRYGVSVAALQRANQLRHAHHIRIGQILLIPARGGAYRPSTAAAPAPVRRAASHESTEQTHVVRSGETLSAIARRYGTTASTISRANALSDSHRIFPGQRLRIPAAGARTDSRHTVQPGETLAEIARRYGIAIGALKAANQIVGHMIYPRQVLVIP